MVAPPLAGAMRVRWGSFLLFDFMAAVLWSSVGIGAGLIFYRQVDRVLAALGGLGGWAPVVGVILLAGFVGGKWVQRRRFYRSLRMARISVDELKRLIDGGANPVVFDVRTTIARERDPQRIPGAIAFDLSQVDAVVAELPDEREVILYCNCPSEASAARNARRLMDRGVRSVRPLAGGLQAWTRALGSRRRQGEHRRNPHICNDDLPTGARLRQLLRLSRICAREKRLAIGMTRVPSATARKRRREMLRVGISPDHRRAWKAAFAGAGRFTNHGSPRSLPAEPGREASVSLPSPDEVAAIASHLGVGTRPPS